MKKFIMVIIFICILRIVPIMAADLKWDASTGDVKGYNVYFFSASESYNKDVGDVTTVSGIDNELNLLPGETYTFHVTAYNSKGESGISNTVEYTAKEYIPPEDNLPPIIIEIPPTVKQLILNFLGD